MLSIRLVLAAMLFSASAVATAESPESTVSAFYNRFIHPSAKYHGRPDFERVADLLTLELHASLKAQDKYERYCVKIAPPDIKPHMIDQNPFLLAPDGIKQYLGAKSSISGGTATVVAHLSDGDVTWRDTVVLRREKGHWRVSNIEWEGGGSLSERLRYFMNYRCKT